METSVASLIKFSISLLSLINPFGALPVFLALTKDLSSDEIKEVALTCGFTVVITITMAMVLGTNILDFFGISMGSFQIAGGLLIAHTAFSMVTGKLDKFQEGDTKNHGGSVKILGVVPLGIPMTSGPATITASILHGEQFRGWYQWFWAIAITILMGIFIYYFFTFSRPIGKRIGKNGLNIFSKIMGLLLLSLAVEFIANGIRNLLAQT